MNFFVYWVNKKGEKELITCELNDQILPGVIRDSVLELAKQWGIKASEREFTIHELIEAAEEGRVLESFGTGTAAVICPINIMNYKGKNFKMFKNTNPNENISGDLGLKIYNYLLDVQYGIIKNYKWVTSFEI